MSDAVGVVHLLAGVGAGSATVSAATSMYQPVEDMVPVARWVNGDVTSIVVHTPTSPLNAGANGITSVP